MEEEKIKFYYIKYVLKLFTTEVPLGNVAIVYDDNIAFAQRVIKFCGGEKLLNKYLVQYFSSNKVKNYLDKVSFGSTIAGIKWGRIINICVNYKVNSIK